MGIFQIFLFLCFPPGGTGSIPRFIFAKKSFTFGETL